jgi:MYXO-CTERM domain-containing protein
VWCGGSATSQAPGRRSHVLLLGMVALGLATFAAMVGFIVLCDRV